MAVGGSFLTLAVLGSYTLDIVNGRGWVCIALVIFAQWRVWPVVGGALIFALTDALQLQLAITTTFSDVPREVMLALPYLAVIVALAIWGKSVRYPASYLKAHRRDLATPTPGGIHVDHRRTAAGGSDRHARKGLARAGSRSAPRWRTMGPPGSGHNRGSRWAPRSGTESPTAWRTSAGFRRRRTPAAPWPRCPPCDMCTGAILLYGIPRVVVGENHTFLGGEELLRSRGVEVVVVNFEECMAMMRDFIAAYPQLWNEDIGV